MLFDFDLEIFAVSISASDQHGDVIDSNHNKCPLSYAAQKIIRNFVKNNVWKILKILDFQSFRPKYWWESCIFISKFIVDAYSKYTNTYDAGYTSLLEQTPEYVKCYKYLMDVNAC